MLEAGCHDWLGTRPASSILCFGRQWQMKERQVAGDEKSLDYPLPDVGRFVVAIGAGLILTACGLGQAAAPELAAEPALHVAQAGAQDSPVPIETPVSTITIAPEPSLTPTPTHPLMIEVMRQQDYPGSEIILEEWLEPGATYDRYIASYMSEGNKIFALLTQPRGPIPPDGWPVIVFNHGYIPPAQYRTTERYVAYVDTFANNGYIVFATT